MRIFLRTARPTAPPQPHPRPNRNASPSHAPPSARTTARLESDLASEGRTVVGVISDSDAPAGGTPEDLALPTIPVSAGALIFDRSGRLLILKPTYKSGWTIPGGVMEEDGETPWQACRREGREECGLEVR